MPKFLDKRERAGGRDFPCPNSWTKGSGLGGATSLAKTPGHKEGSWKDFLAKSAGQKGGGGWGHAGVIWGYMGLYGVIWGHIGGILGAYWGHIGGILGSYGVIWGYMGSISELKVRDLKFGTYLSLEL